MKLRHGISTTSYSGNALRQYKPGLQYKYSTQEALPEFPTNHPSYKLATIAIQKRVEDFIAASEPYIESDSEVAYFNSTLKDLRQPSLPKASRYGTVGDTGSGKSALINVLLGKRGKDSVAHEGDGAAAVTQVTQEYVQAPPQQRGYSSSVTFYDETILEERLTRYIDAVIECANLSPDDADSEEYSDTVSQAWTFYKRLLEMFPKVDWLRSWPVTKKYLKPMSSDRVELLVTEFLGLTKKCLEANGVDTIAGKKGLSHDSLSGLQAKICEFTVPGLLSWTVENVR